MPFSAPLSTASCLSTSLQLQCDKRNIRAHIGGEFILICKYDASRFLYSKKYWCRGNSGNTCEILVDSESASKTKNTHRSVITDAGRRGLLVKVTNLQFDDSGVYWVGIDKIYADIMTSVSVVVTQGKNEADSCNAYVCCLKTCHVLVFRTWSGLPLWYSLLRWSSFASLLIILSATLQCIKTRHRKHAKRRKKVCFRQHRHLAQRP
uniref:Immunoglobulin V-set domain-containing protein n=1 Tax=Amphiprion percula TaxID=161767 RepID=A0A3P8U968_AMPPE